ncbi:MAG TPA: methyl-accepting chemotaxis protein [Longimicrobium sp.]|nr:methyl-accepting chemotaxis protein [Longimicrobium sp.]
MRAFFRTAAAVLAALALLALVGFTVAAILGSGGREQALSVLAYAATGYVFLMVGFRAYQRAAAVDAGPAFLIHAASWALLLPVYVRVGAGPAPTAAYAAFALGAFLNAPSLLHFTAALAFPRRVRGWLPGFAAFYAFVLLLWIASVAGVAAGEPGIARVLDGGVRDRGLDLLAFWGALAILGIGLATAVVPRMKRQLAWAAASILVGLGPGWLARVPGAGPVVSADVLPGFPLYALLWVLMPLGLSYAIVRYNLFDAGRLRTRSQQLSIELLQSTNVDEVARHAAAALHEDFDLAAASLWAHDDAGLPVQMGGDAGEGDPRAIDRALRGGDPGVPPSVLVYPLHYRGQVEAALWLERAWAEPFEEGHLQYLGMVEPVLALALHLRRVDDRVRVSAEELTALAREVDQVTAELRLTGESVTTAVQEVSEGSSRQTEDFRRIAAAIAGLRAASREIAARLASADRLGGETLARSESAGADVELLVARVKDGAARLGSVTAEVTTLRERSGEIGSISTAIREVSEQTNLLALNAAIEASRAGEHGRGFAVVADEVRKLAESSAERAQRIGDLVEEVRGEIARVAEAITSARGDMAEGAEGADRASSALRESLTRVARLRAEIAEVSTLTASAEEENETIAGAVTRATEISEQNAAAAEETAAATEEQLASLESVAASVRELSTLGARMFELLHADAPYRPGADAAGDTSTGRAADARRGQPA